MPPKKILIIRFSSIGDIVLTTPVIRCLKQQTAAEIHFLTKKGFASILNPNPYLSKVHLLKEDFGVTIEELKAEKFDLIIDLHKNLRTARVKRALKIKAFAFNKVNLEKWLMVNLKWNRLPDKHIVMRYLAATKSLGIQYDGQGLDYFIPNDQEVETGVLADQYFSHQEELRALMANNQYVAFVIGAAHATKRLPKEKISVIASKIQQPVLLLGGPGETEVGEEISKAAGTQVINTCGKFSLHQSASLVRQAGIVISHDTGLMHIAAAFNKEIISVWGNTIPDFGMYPFFKKGVKSNTTVEVSGLSCRPCSKIGYQECPKGHFKCMQEIDESKIVGKVQEKLLNQF